MTAGIQYAYNRKIGGYLVSFLLGYSRKELYKGCLELFETTFKGHRVFSTGGASVFGRHCKFHKRLGNKVIYEFIRSKR